MALFWCLLTHGTAEAFPESDIRAFCTMTESMAIGHWGIISSRVPRSDFRMVSVAAVFR